MIANFISTKYISIIVEYAVIMHKCKSTVILRISRKIPSIYTDQSYTMLLGTCYYKSRPNGDLKHIKIQI